MRLPPDSKSASPSNPELRFGAHVWCHAGLVPMDLLPAPRQKESFPSVLGTMPLSRLPRSLGHGWAFLPSLYTYHCRKDPADKPKWLDQEHGTTMLVSWTLLHLAAPRSRVVCLQGTSLITTKLLYHPIIMYLHCQHYDLFLLVRQSDAVNAVARSSFLASPHERVTGVRTLAVVSWQTKRSQHPEPIPSAQITHLAS